MAVFNIVARVNGKLAACFFDAGLLNWITCEIGQEVKCDALPDARPRDDMGGVGVLTIDIANDNGRFHQVFPACTGTFGKVE